MIETNEAELQKLKKSFLDTLIETLVDILELIETKADINENYITRIKNTTKGLAKIAEIEGNDKLKSVFKRISNLVESQDLSVKTKDIKNYVIFLKTLNR